MRMRIAPALAAACLLFAAAPALAASQNTTPIPAISPAPPINHVFVIVLENEDYATIFGADTPSPYLGRELPAKGALFTNYYATGHASLSNYLTMISGQPPTPMTLADCSKFSDFAQTAPLTANGIAVGNGCVYPPAVKTVADQLESARLTWHGYMEDMGNDPAREAKACARPVPDGNGVLEATPTDSYAYRHDPFIYFHSVADRPSCAANVVRLENLTTDLAQTATTPNFSFIVPSVCNDGHDKPTCANGQPGGLPAADVWLKIWVPKIMNSPAFKKDGLLIITFDEAARDGSACCNEPSGPNVKAPGYYGPGGGKIGAVLLSRFIKPGTIVADPVNHYGLLRSVEQIFALPYLGYASDPALNTFSGAFAAP
ncbi:MAG TPA: alkaline phosphatase family protein [Rhizomicrobium sp.]|nr:alkaline phosphatase family protein [Rhizomicrobium sp.]